MRAAAAFWLSTAIVAGCAQIDAAAPPPPQPSDPVELGKRLLAQNRPDLALDAFERGISDVGGAEALTGAAVSLLKLGRGGEARRLLEAALARDPDLAVARNALGVYHYEAGRYAAALAEFRRADELTGGADPVIALNIGVAAAALEDRAGDKPKLDAFDYDVIQYGHGVYRLVPRAAETTREENSS
ncbi:tetratricopeptide repeat protein [Pikeienuella piscinae]|uniref:Tetratricopeptide repeat protein n=1 Tax=Pikeienuella piscinae TaxID=2748098 RepID=A0A7M3T5D9_9RHOB|nr:tetratricopeptide repeat protein [Pikeienuella piscinae]QIE57220.1 tetratricopeptide repeat protein [Pikeienuella piscinae]